MAGAITGQQAVFTIHDVPFSPAPVLGVDRITVTAGSINLSAFLFASINIASDNPVFLSDNVSIAADTDITVGGTIDVFGSLAAGNNITSDGTIMIGGGSLNAGGNITSTNGDIVLTSTQDGIGSIFAGGNVTAHNLTAPSVTAANLTVGSTVVGPFQLIADEVTAGFAINLVNVSSVSPFGTTLGPNGGFTPTTLTLSATSLISVGSTLPTLLANGSTASGQTGDAGNGGGLFVALLGDGLTVSPTGDFTTIEANGGDFSTSGAGGNGGTIGITTTGPITVDSDISATTGRIPQNTTPRGDGGTVDLSSSDTVTVNGKIEVSSVEPSPFPGAVRRSAKGGAIKLTSTRATGVAINVSNTSQLLSLLDNAATGPGGTVTILATGASSSVNFAGNAEVDRGTIDIQQTGPNGSINIVGNSAGSPAGLVADVVKVQTMGSNGTLNIGNAFLSANSVLKLLRSGRQRKS